MFRYWEIVWWIQEATVSWIVNGRARAVRSNGINTCKPFEQLKEQSITGCWYMFSTCPAKLRHCRFGVIGCQQQNLLPLQTLCECHRWLRLPWRIPDAVGTFNTSAEHWIGSLFGKGYYSCTSVWPFDLQSPCSIFLGSMDRVLYHIIHMNLILPTLPELCWFSNPMNYQLWYIHIRL